MNNTMLVIVQDLLNYIESFGTHANDKRVARARAYVTAVLDAEQDQQEAK